MINNRFKFRVWSTYPSSIYKKENNKMIYLTNNKGSLSDLTENSKWKVMQCTGLEDKNRKLIYEGDIIRILYTDWASQSRDDERTLDQYKKDISSIGKVCFIGCSWEIVFWDSKYKEWYPSSIYEGKHGERTIIGNIYENPELLNNE